MRLQRAGAASSPATAEVRANPRARSAVLRVAERTDVPLAEACRHDARSTMLLLCSRCCWPAACTWCDVSLRRRAACSPSSTGAQAEAAQLDADFERLEAERQAQATPLRVEKVAREKLRMRTATPAVTQYVTTTPRAARGTAGGRAMSRRAMSRAQATRRAPPACAASTTRPARCWPRRRRRGARSFVVALVGAGLLRAARAARSTCRCIGTDFYQKQGENRYARTLELPASRGRILDRNGLMLATSVPVPSVWAIPKDFEADRAAAPGAGQAAGHDAGRAGRAARRQRATSSGCAARSTSRRGSEVHGARPQGRAPGARVQAQVPRGRGGGARGRLHQHRGPRARKASSSRFQKRPARAATARAASSRTGSAAWSRTSATASTPVDGRDIALSIDSKVQFFAYQRVRDAVAEHRRQGRQRGGARRADRRGAGAGQLPELHPGDRRNLTGAQLRNRALTDTFEPGSTMKPFIAALGARDRPRHARRR